MNNKQWRKLGYKVLFREGCAYLYRPQSGVCLTTPICGGQWMDHDDVNRAPWLSVPEPAEFKAVADACYCEDHVHCDFCTGLRKPAALLREIGVQNFIKHGQDRALGFVSEG